MIIAKNYLQDPEIDSLNRLVDIFLTSAEERVKGRRALTLDYYVYNTLADCGAARREEQRWSYDTDIAGLRLDLKAELNYICHWINNRMQFLDNQFLHSLSAIEHPQAPSTPVDKEVVYTLQGVKAPVGYKGVVIRGGKLEIRR